MANMALRNVLDDSSIVEETDQIYAISSFKWTISDISSKSTTPKLTSSEFNAGANDLVKWRLHFYPNGINKNYEGYTSIFLHLVSSHEAVVLAEYTFSILNAEEKKVSPSVYSKHELFQATGYGNPQYIKKNILLDKAQGYVTNDDKLTIVVDIKVFGRSGNKVQVSDDLGKVLFSSKFSDVTLIAGINKYEAHKVILNARSPVFGAMLNRLEKYEMRENKQSQLYMTDIKPEVLKQMLNFIYTDKVFNIKEMAEDLLAAADKYQLERLKLMCEEVLRLSLTNENAAKILVLADLYSSNGLKTQVIDFICSHVKDVKETEEFKTMAKDYPNLLLECFGALGVKYQSLIEK